MVAKTRAVYQLRIALQDIQPTVWRQIQVWEDITMGKLHDILQTVMDWEIITFTSSGSAAASTACPIRTTI